MALKMIEIKVARKLFLAILLQYIRNVFGSNISKNSLFDGDDAIKMAQVYNSLKYIH